MLYAYNSHAPQHEVARWWWESAINGRELIGFPHEVMLGFVRIATNPRLGRSAVALSVAQAVVESWLKVPVARVLLPQEDHSAEVLQLLMKSHSSGTLTSDASLAVYAIQSRATLYSNDTDFARFPGLDWKNPLLNT